MIDLYDLDYDFVVADDLHANVNAYGDADVMNLVVLKYTVDYLNWCGDDDDDDDADASAGVALAQV